jgi:chromosome segregation ATPase
LSKEKNNNQILIEEINKLKRELNEEKIKIKEHEKTIKDLKNNLDNEKKNFDKFKEEIEKEKLIKKKFEKESKESFLDAIMEKDKEIKDLKLKLSRYPFELMEGEKLMVVIIRSTYQKIDFAVIYKNTDKFHKIEE